MSIAEAACFSALDKLYENMRHLQETLGACSVQFKGNTYPYPGTGVPGRASCGRGELPSPAPLGYDLLLHKYNFVRNNCKYMYEERTAVP
ncbi:hypothetical protein EVAR_23607_1 [Eumeta japonica]|uniref:Uncharacterized protein n=1 Tax=Eumeta variegata TaxID=151549 RepID=A0A4C1X1H4_EUMVA|nr:hypothetical protein EVAR_23607_1 [Eumeta japonica]